MTVTLAKLQLSLVGCIMDQEVCQHTVLGHILVIPLGNVSLRVWISMTSWELAVKFL
jgi:hypothetical protein